MIFEGEAFGDQGLEVARAAMNLEDALAGPAFEVVVVLLARHLVPGRRIG